MPTTKQLEEMWAAEFMFPWMRRDDDPMKEWPKEKLPKFTGEIIGEIKVDPETGDLKIIPIDKENQ